MRKFCVFGVLLCLVCFMVCVPAFAMSFEDVPAEGSVHEFDLSAGYSSLFPDPPFTTDRYLILQIGSSFYLLDVPTSDSFYYRLYNSGSKVLLYTPSSPRMLGVDQSGNLYYFTFSYASTEVTYRRITDTGFGDSVEAEYTIAPAVYESGEGDNYVSYDLYVEMGFIPDTMVSYTPEAVGETYFVVFLYIIIFLMVALFAVGLIKLGGRK